MKSERLYLNWKDFMTARYGAALYRVPVDLGFGCPHRDSAGAGGCTFCAEDGGRARQAPGADDSARQVEQGVAFARRRYGAQRFMLYIQAFTGTFAEPGCFERMLDGLLSMRKFDAVSIGTRPDSLSDAVIEYLKRVNRDADVWIEFGVQSTHDRTLERINRGHDWACSREAVLRTARAGLNAAAHLILGLPGEGMAEWCESAQRVAALPVRALKLHNLHVIKGTALADAYAQSPFPLLDEHRYAEGVVEVLRRVPRDVALMRLTTDTPGESLIAPRWSMSKGEFVDFLERRMRFRGVEQGDLHGERTSGCGRSEFEDVVTDDGSVTFWSAEFKEHFHAKAGAVTEAAAKFVGPSSLRERLAAGDVRLLDICFGLGYNTLVACETAQSAGTGRLAVTALEIDIGVIRAAAERVRPPDGAALEWRAILGVLEARHRWEGASGSITLLHGDARDLLGEAAADGPFDIVFLDAFSTQRNAELWTVDFFRRLRTLMTPDGVLLTYCAALPVRAGMLEAGFHVGETAPVGRRRGGTIAAVRETDAGTPLAPDELALIRNTKRGIPYRDPGQVWSNRRILVERERERREERVEKVSVHGG